MIELFECKVKYNKVNEQGHDKIVTESYLVDAVSFCEAEKRFTKEMETNIAGDFFIQDIKRTKYSEVVQNDEYDRFFKVKVVYIDISEKTGGEKRSVSHILVQADNTKTALEITDNANKEVLVEYEKTSVSETKIMEVFMYNEEKEDNNG
jgi:hypothetical protein